MKISLHWLRRYIHLTESPTEIADLLTKSGLEVSHIATIHSNLEDNLAGIMLGQVVHCAKHPNADKLQVTQVDIGKTDYLTIVCGAPNVKKGQKVAVAPIGTTLSTYTGSIVKIKPAKIRGICSEGMLCAEDEIGIGPNHAEILEFTTPLPVGSPLTSLYTHQANDVIFTIELTPNRIDACSHIGVARELSALLNRPLVYPTLMDLPDAPCMDSSLPMNVQVIASTVCPRYAGIVMQNIRIAPSPTWLQESLKSIGLQPINNVVDVMNWVMHELGHPLHAFDYDQLAGKQLQVRLANPGEMLTTLDSINRTLVGGELLIADGEKGVALAGIIGSKASAVSQHTKRIFIESAYFEPTTIRQTAKQHQIHTEASFRYERGADPHIVLIALRRACYLIAKIACGKAASMPIAHYPVPIPAKSILVRYQRIDDIIGAHIPQEKIHQILTGLGIDIQGANTTNFTAVVPPRKVDVTREIDIIEEILRIYGCDQITQAPLAVNDLYLSNEYEPIVKKIAAQWLPILTANGYDQIITNPLVSASNLLHANTVDNDSFAIGEPIPLLNLLSNRQGYLRNNLLISGLEVIAYNQKRKQMDLKLFEFGKIYHHQPNNQYNEIERLGIWLTGHLTGPSWTGSPQEVTFHDLKKIVYKLLEKWGVVLDTLVAIDCNNDYYAQGLSFNHHKGFFMQMGKVADRHLNALAILQPVYYAEIDLCQLVANYDKSVTPLIYRPISKFPVVKRDLSLVVNENVVYQDIQQVLNKHAEPLIQQVHVVDCYQGTQLQNGKKNYSLRFDLQDVEKTLDDQTIHQVMQRLMALFQSQLDAIIRK